MRHILFLTFFLILSYFSSGQAKKAQWANKYNGTYTVYPHHLTILREDTTIFRLSVQFYELSMDTCKRIAGKIKINNKVFDVFDSTQYIDNEGFKDPSNYFHTYLPQGDYRLTAFIDKNYYHVKTEKLVLMAKSSYTFSFYLIRKDELKKRKAMR